jgi:hypothetical protein
MAKWTSSQQLTPAQKAKVIALQKSKSIRVRQFFTAFILGAVSIFIINLILRS